MNSRFVLALAISAGMALLVTGVFYQVAVGGGKPAAAPTTEIVVAAKDLEIGAALKATDLRTQPWPAQLTPEDSFRDIESVIDRTPKSGILAGEPILARRLADPGSGLGLAPKVPEGMRAMSVRVDDVIGVAGFVLPEARVDVLITGLPRAHPEAGQMTKTILGNVRVLSAGEQLSPDASGRPQKAAVVTLLLTPRQAELVTLAQTHGRIQLVLRNAKDDDVPETAGIREAELFGERVRAENVSRPAASPAPPPAPKPVAVAAVEPAPYEIEVIRGNRVSVQTVPQGGSAND